MDPKVVLSLCCPSWSSAIRHLVVVVVVVVVFYLSGLQPRVGFSLLVPR